MIQKYFVKGIKSSFKTRWLLLSFFFLTIDRALKILTKENGTRLFIKLQLIQFL